MFSEKEKPSAIYKVVINEEEQYTIWPANQENAPGWRDVAKVGPKGDCLAYIEEKWTDMRPLSLRQRMAISAQKSSPP